MVIWDRRDEFEYSESDLEDIAAFCHELRENGAFQDTLQNECLGLVHEVADEADGGIDDAARRTIARWMAKEASGAFFQLRNQILTTAEADLEENDVILMESNLDEEKTIYYVVHTADPDATGVRVWRVDPDDGPRVADHTAGHVHFEDRFKVARTFRDSDRSSHELAVSIGNELAEDGDVEEVIGDV